MSCAEESVVCAQLDGIFAACACGLVLGVLYDVCWLLRQRRRGAGLTFLLDVLFSMACCAVLFVLSVGIFQQRMRGFLPIVMAIGGIFWELTGGRGVRRFYKWAHTRLAARKFAKKP